MKKPITDMWSQSLWSVVRKRQLSVPLLMCSFFVPMVFGLVLPAEAQTSPHGLALELHVGYGGGGTHPDGLVGGGLTYRFSTYLEGTGFTTAVVARSTGRAVFAGAGLRLIPVRGAVRPYLAVGPLLAIRAYTEGHLGEFATLGLEAGLDNPTRRWRLFVEGRAMHGGGSWGQLVAGVRATVTRR